VLWAWDYGTFLPDYTLACTGSGISNSSNRLRDPARGNPPDWQLRLTAKGGNDLMPTSNPGVGIRWYFQTAKGEVVKTSVQQTAFVSLAVSDDGAGRYLFNPGQTVTLSAKAELIKTGEVVYGAAISPQADSQLWREAGTLKGNQPLGQGGVLAIAPACRLSQKDYRVDMGRWATQPPGQLPATGPETAFELQLACTGEVSHLRLRFEDGGSRTSANQNITLYPAFGGDAIEGLEVEMLFNGSRIDIGDTRPIDAGRRGRSQQNAAPVYDAAAPVALTARYVQHAAITYGAAPWTGTLSGNVNFWLTYD
jgi:type 1 fimbria pilin